MPVKMVYYLWLYHEWFFRNTNCSIFFTHAVDCDIGDYSIHSLYQQFTHHFGQNLMKSWTCHTPQWSCDFTRKSWVLKIYTIFYI